MMVLLFFTVFLLTTFFVFAKRDKGYDNRIQAESTTLRIYIIDPKNNSVVYFNRSDLRNKRRIDINTFYSHFHINDIDKVKSWIFDICTDYKNADKYVEADVLLNHGRSTYFSLLQYAVHRPFQFLIY